MHVIHLIHLMHLNARNAFFTPKYDILCIKATFLCIKSSSDFQGYYPFFLLDECQCDSSTVYKQ